LVADLAGSERVAKSGAEGVVKAQAIEINKSLTALGRVVKSLAAHHAHVPYRDSTLTMLLRDSFGGKASATVVVCVAGAGDHDEETTRSLQFGDRLGGVRSTEAAVQGPRSAAGTGTYRGDKEELEARLGVMRGELAGLDAGGVNPAAASPAAARAFYAKVEELGQLGKRIQALERVEYNAGKQRAGSELAELKGQARLLHEDIERAKGAVDRLTQQYFWREPTRAWAKKDAEIRELEGVLCSMA
jgi:hypothetical protein